MSDVRAGGVSFILAGPRDGQLDQHGRKRRKDQSEQSAAAIVVTAAEPELQTRQHRNSPGKSRGYG